MVFPLHKPDPYSLYRWGFLHFRYLKCLVTKHKPPSLPMKICQQIIHHSGLRGTLSSSRKKTMGKFRMIFLDLLVGCLEKVRNIIKKHDPHMVFLNQSMVKLYQHRPQIAKTNFCVINVENSVTSARSSRQLFWMLFLDAIYPAMERPLPKVGRHPPLLPP